MDFKSFLGDAYQEGMSNEELIAALEAAELPEDHSKQLREITAESRERKQKLKAQQGTIDELQNQVAALLRENSINKSKTHFIALGYDDETAAAAATALADGDTDTLFECQKKANEAAQARWKAEAMKDTPAPAPGDPKYEPGSMTKEAFSRLSLEDKQKFAASNPEEYKAMYT